MASEDFEYSATGKDIDYYDDEYGDDVEKSLKELKDQFGEDFSKVDNSKPSDQLPDSVPVAVRTEKPKDTAKPKAASTSKSSRKQARANQKKKAEKKAVPVFVEPVIKSVPKIETKQQLFSFINSEKIAALRPQAKVVAILHSSKKKQVHKGLMFRKRTGKKEKNIWKQFVQPTEDPSLPKLFILVDQSIKETKPREVSFKIAYWKEKWPYARLVDNRS